MTGDVVRVRGGMEGRIPRHISALAPCAELFPYQDPNQFIEAVPGNELTEALGRSEVQHDLRRVARVILGYDPVILGRTRINDLVLYRGRYDLSPPCSIQVASDTTLGAIGFEPWGTTVADMVPVAPLGLSHTPGS